MITVHTNKFPDLSNAWMPALMLLCLAGLPGEALPDTGGNLPESAHNRDFDFEFGEWSVQLSRRVNPLTGSDEWVGYTGTSIVRKVWDGRANLGELNVEGPTGNIQGLSLRVYNPETGLWRIHWANSRDGLVGEAMVGGFQGGVGRFHNREIFDGRPVEVRFVFSDITPTTFRLEQAFSEDGGESWEANWIANFERLVTSGANE